MRRDGCRRATSSLSAARRRPRANSRRSLAFHRRRGRPAGRREPALQPQLGPRRSRHQAALGPHRRALVPRHGDRSGDLIVLAVQRRGRPGLGRDRSPAGDTLLLQGTWEAMESLSTGRGAGGRTRPNSCAVRRCRMGPARRRRSSSWPRWLSCSPPGSCRRLSPGFSPRAPSSFGRAHVDSSTARSTGRP